MKLLLLNKGYPHRLVNREMGKVKHKPNSKSWAYNKIDGVPLATTYHCALNAFGQIIRKHLHLLYMNEELTKKVHPSSHSFILWSKKMSNYLVRAKLYPLETNLGSFKCLHTRCVSIL